MDFYKFSRCNFVYIVSHLKLGEIKQSLLIAVTMTLLLTDTHFTTGIGLEIFQLVLWDPKVWERRTEAGRFGWGMEGSACGKSLTDHPATISIYHLPASILLSEAPLDRIVQFRKKEVVQIYNGKSFSY